MTLVPGFEGLGGAGFAEFPRTALSEAAFFSSDTAFPAWFSVDIFRCSFVVFGGRSFILITWFDWFFRRPFICVGIISFN